MKEPLARRPAIRRATFLTCAPLLVWALVALACGAVSVPHSPLSLQDNSPPHVSLDPDRLDFGDQVLRRWSRAKRITVTTTGGQTLYVNSVAVLSGDDERHFSITNDTCTGAEVVPYRSCVLDISFGPFHTGSHDAELKITDNAPDSPRTLRLEGDGINSINVPPFDED